MAIEVPYEPTTPTTHRGHSNREGSCMLCTRYSTPQGHSFHNVWVITGNHQEVRVCDPCFADIRAAVNRG